MARLPPCAAGICNRRIYIRAALYRGEQTWQAAPPVIEVVDSVGAGDASIGGWLSSLMSRPEADGGQHLRFAVGAIGGIVAGAHYIVMAW
ncbi:PfkB family carbohydrate kinase [Janthinobacterium sp. NFX145]|uniref:PfkB family carbohydrate kinase n=1 Tax=Janthinobacterium sp. NFX145 TaxID=3415602 RepID=UPI003CC5A753